MASPGYTIIDGGYSGGKMARATGEWWARFEEKYVVDAGRWYGIQVRVRQNSNSGSVGKLKVGFVGVKVDGVTLCDTQGTNDDRFTQFLCAPETVPVDADWHLYQFFWKG